MRGLVVPVGGVPLRLPGVVEAALVGAGLALVAPLLVPVLGPALPAVVAGVPVLGPAPAAARAPALQRE